MADVCYDCGAVVARGHVAHVLQEAVGLVTLVTSLAILEVVTMLRPGLSLTLWAGCQQRGNVKEAI